MSHADEPLDATETSATAPASARRIPWKVHFAAGAALLLVVGGGALVWSLLDDELDRHEIIRFALEQLDDRDDPQSRQQARDLAEELLAADISDPDFPGAVEFILGIVAFREAESQDEVAGISNYRLAVRYLDRAEKHALIDARRPEWAYALGISLYRLGQAAAALPLLEEAVADFEHGRVAASFDLTDVYLDLKTPDNLDKALALNTALVKTGELQGDDRNRAYQQQARILLARNETFETINAALQQISEQAAQSQGTVVLRARTLMLEDDLDRYEEAFSHLKPVADSQGLDQTYARQARYLMGVCAENSGRIDAAISNYLQAARQYPESHEGLAANLRAGNLLRKEGRSEEALEAYRRVLRSAGKPDEFRNRWLTLDELQRGIRTAWAEWVEANSYSEAITLSRMMPPLLSAEEAYGFAAHANQQWAEFLDDKLTNSRYGRRGGLQAELRERWRLSGRAFDELADALRSSSQYSDALWISAGHYRNGHDFENALGQLDRFIETRPRRLLPAALVRRGEVLMDLDRRNEALDQFQQVIETFETDPAWFRALYDLGRCYLELDRPAHAERIWRSILDSPKFEPKTNEWRLALFSLGKLLYHTAVVKMSRARLSPTPDQTPDYEDAFARWDEAANRLDLFLRRYPDDAEVAEARYLLAKSLQQSAAGPRHKLKTAETENARNELRASMEHLFQKALAEFRRLQSGLFAAAEDDRLDELRQSILRACYFEIAHTYYALGNYEQAIVAYSGAANRYPQDPQVLLAYMQMTNCYDRLGKPTDARSMLEQAKIIERHLPDSVFQSRATTLMREEWQRWLQWAGRMHHSKNNDNELDGAI
jgi:tetratricopeptide (TPR) repeat protein